MNWKQLPFTSSEKSADISKDDINQEKHVSDNKDNINKDDIDHHEESIKCDKDLYEETKKNGKNKSNHR
ncbi:13224_t:CDS:2 [Racocetra persica]|uniref:13224_t:CDS:1 n=1 Tax=Racocetra persica TaxID=160502 RepID=A0ACA9SA39_9GLOM|nr:13224_t:CDS:2 [Racocetra persica]